MRRSIFALSGAVVFAAALAQVPSSRAQQPRWEPPDPTNLQALPKDITKPELVQTMRGFTRALGVRCPFCHAGEEGKPLDTFNFASDEKPEKVTARKMIRMVMDINGQYLKGVVTHDEHGDDAADGDAKVTCYTCHRGEQHPASAPPPRAPGGR
jgi:photosynthetic reaction center cytochrome c subunit